MTRRENTLQWATTRLDTQKNRSATLKSLALRLIWLLYKSRYFYFALINHIDWGGEAGSKYRLVHNFLCLSRNCPARLSLPEVTGGSKKRGCTLYTRTPPSLCTLILALTKKKSFLLLLFYSTRKNKTRCLIYKTKNRCYNLGKSLKSTMKQFQADNLNAHACIVGWKGLGRREFCNNEYRTNYK